MPESECMDCGERKWFTAREKMTEWELLHHQASFKECHPESWGSLAGIKGFHKCQSFQEFNEETGYPTLLRIYNYDRLVETYE